MIQSKQNEIAFYHKIKHLDLYLKHNNLHAPALIDFVMFQLTPVLSIIIALKVNKYYKRKTHACAP